MSAMNRTSATAAITPGEGGLNILVLIISGRFQEDETVSFSPMINDRYIFSPHMWEKGDANLAISQSRTHCNIKIKEKKKNHLLSAKRNGQR